KRSSFLCGPIAVVNSDIDSPIWRHRPHLRLNLHYPADVLVAIGDLGIRRRTAIGLGLPTKELRIKIDRLGRVIREQLVPTKRICFAFHSDAFVYLRLPNTKVRARRIS